MDDVYTLGLKRLWGWVNSCSADTELQNLQDAIERAKDAMEIAELSDEFLSMNPQAWHKFQQAREALDKVSEGLDKAENICKDIKAIKRIHSAIKVLNNDSVIYEDPERASKAFGDLFVGFGILARHLPPPADAFAQFLEGFGDFFGNMSKKIIPELRPREQRYKEYLP